jgi:hypothetical protein
LSPEEREKLESRKKPRPKADKLAEARQRIEQFKAKYPDAKSAVPVLRKYLPNIRSARLFLRAVYDLPKQEVFKLLPRRKRLTFKPVSFGEYTPAPSQPAPTGPPPPKPGEAELLETSPREERRREPSPPPGEKPRRGRRKKTEED